MVYLLMQYQIFYLNLIFWYLSPNFSKFNLNQRFITVIRIKPRVCNSPNYKKKKICACTSMIFFIMGVRTESKKVTQNLYKTFDNWISRWKGTVIGEFRLQAISCIISSPLLLNDGLSFFIIFSRSLRVSRLLSLFSANNEDDEKNIEENIL